MNNEDKERDDLDKKIVFTEKDFSTPELRKDESKDKIKITENEASSEKIKIEQDSFEDQKIVIKKEGFKSKFPIRILIISLVCVFILITSFFLYKNFKTTMINNIDQALFEKGTSFEVIITSLDKEVKRNPNKTETIIELSNFYILNSNFKKAIDEFQKASNLDPTDEYTKGMLKILEAIGED